MGNLNVLGLVNTKKNEFSEDRVDIEKNRQAKKNFYIFETLKENLVKDK